MLLLYCFLVGKLDRLHLKLSFLIFIRDLMILSFDEERI
jgi:hypothetical protein